jgi:hypothetical protein
MTKDSEPNYGILKIILIVTEIKKDENFKKLLQYLTIQG